MKFFLIALLLGCSQVSAQHQGHHQHESLELVRDISPQPVIAQAVRLKEALAYVGSPMSPEDEKKIDDISKSSFDETSVERIQQVLDPYCLAFVNINPEARVKVERGPATPILMQGGWTSFLVKVHNEGMVTAPLEVESPNAIEPYNKLVYWGDRVHPDIVVQPGEVANRFLDAQMYRGKPLNKNLSGLPLEYAIVQLYSKDAGMRDVEIGFNVGQSSRDIGFRNTTNMVFNIKKAVKVYFDVLDDDGKPIMGKFIITDSVERAPGKLSSVYPLPSRRVAEYDVFPDFFFQQQVYRKSGEYVILPPGKFTVMYWRGPEYEIQKKELTVPDNADSIRADFRLKRWTNLSKLGWYSADHHVHAAGCSHYSTPSEGVKPQDMWRQSLGEDLNVSAVLNWGPGWYAQKENFTGKDHPLSNKDNVMRYDIEVSGFPSSHSGHVVLLGLKEDEYPGTKELRDWPSWTLPVLKWGRSQGAIAGYAHSGDGLAPLHTTNTWLDTTITDEEKLNQPIWRVKHDIYTSALPNFVTPRMDGIGANEYIVTAPHGLIDFYSAGDMPIDWELNMWYHTLNAGMKIPLSGETDFPCASDERVGHARSYFKTDGSVSYETYLDAIKKGRSYVSDGFSHIINFSVNGLEPGVKNSTLNLKGQQKVKVKADVAAYLSAVQSREERVVARSSLDKKPHWNIERARIANRKVNVELLVNGFVVDRKEIDADGTFTAVEFNPEITESGWVALRVFASSHSNPVYLELNDQPVLVRKSVEWCMKALDQCWLTKEPNIREEEKKAAKEGYDWARKWYENKLAGKK